MKDHLRKIVDDKQDNLLKRSTVREYLQARMLQGLQENGAFLNWVFHGGTALRFLYMIPRYSEDLDFALVRPGATDNFQSLLGSIQKMFEAENYTLDVKVKGIKTVKSAFLRFRGLLYELGISPHHSEVISVKLEIDTNPPSGAEMTTTIIRRHVMLNLLHHDKASLLAGKLHALLNRRYTKGRDFFDLIWFLSDPSWPSPNLGFLNSALKQTEWNGPEVTEKNWQALLLKRLEKVNWKEIAEDVRPFLEREADISLLAKENCLRLLHR